MLHKGMDLHEKWDAVCSSAHIFGEQFQLEKELIAPIELGWRIEGYVDRSDIEHIRIVRKNDGSESEEASWEVMMYHEEESPLEMLMDVSLPDI